MLLLMRLLLASGLVHVSASIAPKSASPDSSGTSDSDAPSTNICGELIDYINDGTFVFYASYAYDCLRSVPFNDAVALRFIDYYNTTMQFQSTVSLLRDPPEGYQQPAFDLLQGLANLRDNVTANVYKNQYAFEADLQYLIYQVHDTHVDLSAGVLAAFTFFSPYRILSASIDGKEEPKVWFEDDIIYYANHPGSPLPSPIALINGEDVVEYLTRFAALNSQGTLEPHADWNQLMASPALDIQGSASVFAGAATFYPGDELNFTQANGTLTPTRWLAYYDELYFTGPLTTGGDFYNYFVLGLLPASYNNTTLPDIFNTSINWASQFGPEPSITNWSDVTSAYPQNPIVIQEGLYAGGSVVLTGYLLPEISTGVLSVPTFSEFDSDMQPFASAIDQFIGNATSQGIQKVIIDLQQNWGGDVLLAFTTFKQFFPQSTPFAGSHRRSHQLGNILGKTFTEYWNSLTLGDDDNAPIKLAWEANEWVITPRINAVTGENFTSWEEYAGPIQYGGDSFSLTERYNLSNVLFDQSIFNGWLPQAYVQQPTDSEPWDPSNIVILTDGLCASSCSLFVEMMTEAGVQTVAVGGRRESGPMQALSGTRGADSYTAAQLDSDFYDASVQSNDSESSGLDTLTALISTREPGMWINQAGFTLRDQVRSADDPEPLQLKYQPADCRLYWTIDNVLNFTRLWSDAAAAIWDDQSLCVAGSTGFTAKGGGNGTTKMPPPRLFDVPPSPPVTPGIDFDASTTGLLDGSGGSNTFNRFFQSTQVCNLHRSDQCGNVQDLFCQPFGNIGYCVSYCSSRRKTCLVADQSCIPRPSFPLESLANSRNGQYSPSNYRGSTRWEGYCAPKKQSKTSQILNWKN